MQKYVLKMKKYDKYSYQQFLAARSLWTMSREARYDMPSATCVTRFRHIGPLTSRPWYNTYHVQIGFICLLFKTDVQVIVC